MGLHLPDRNGFTGPALEQWDAIDPHMQAELLEKAWCGVCGTTTHIQVRSGKSIMHRVTESSAGAGKEARNS